MGSISPTHWQFGEMEGTVWCLENGVVARCFGERAFVISDIQVKHSSAGTTCKLLGYLFSERSDARMLDGDGVEGLKTADGTNGIGFFLCYTEPARVVQGVRVFVYAGIHLCPNDFADLIVDTRRYWNVSLNPGGVCDDGDFDWWEKVLVEVTMLGVVPSEPFILERSESTRLNSSHLARSRMPSSA